METVTIAVSEDLYGQLHIMWSRGKVSDVRTTTVPPALVRSQFHVDGKIDLDLVAQFADQQVQRIWSLGSPHGWHFKLTGTVTVIECDFDSI